MSDARGAPGRVAKDGATGVSNVSVALTKEQREWLKRNGGSVRARALINTEMEAERRKKNAPIERAVG